MKESATKILLSLVILSFLIIVFFIPIRIQSGTTVPPYNNKLYRLFMTGFVPTVQIAVHNNLQLIPGEYPATLDGSLLNFSIPQPHNNQNIEGRNSQKELNLEARSLSVPRQSSPLRKEIDLTINTNEILPGGSVIFTASTIAGELDPIWLENDVFGELNFEDAWEMRKTGNTFSCSVMMPDSFSGVTNFIAFGFIEDELVSSNKVSITIKPIMSNLRGIKLSGKSIGASNVRSGRMLKVKGIFDDGKEYNISHPNLGTTYYSTSSDVATVTPLGKVEAISPGYTEIKIKNQDFETVFYLEVISMDLGLINTSDDVTPSSDDIVGTSGNDHRADITAIAAGTKAPFRSASAYSERTSAGDSNIRWLSEEELANIKGEWAQASDADYDSSGGGCDAGALGLVGLTIMLCVKTLAHKKARRK